MPDNFPNHLAWLVDTGQRLTCSDGKEAQVWEFRHQQDEEILSSWASYFRNHYCLDTEIDSLRGTARSRKKYLEEIKFPDTTPQGSSVRSGDFGEILVSDYLQFVLDYWVPRTRYSRKTVRNESTRGSDILGFKFLEEGKESPEDILAIFESKARFSAKLKTSNIQNAIDHSNKDPRRRAESLNALNQKLRDFGKSSEAAKVERFQDITDRPYREISGIAALFSNKLFDQDVEATATGKKHWNANELILIVIKGENMMQLVHELYRRAADEA